MNRGKVYLIGAGPGDVELLTLKAVRALAHAEVILLDDLVNREVLQFADPHARVIEVGKRGGCKSTPQAFIHRQMIAEAKAGRTVARLKGGDPFVFGRGGEEMAALQAAGIEVQIISGVTAGIAAPAAVGIPVTHRDWNRGVTFITGHARDDAQIDWRALAKTGTTLVIYMGISNLASIVEELQAGGMDPTMPAAIIQNGTRSTQKHVVSQMRHLTEDAVRSGIASPAVVVIGKVATLANSAALDDLAAAHPVPSLVDVAEITDEHARVA